MAQKAILGDSNADEAGCLLFRVWGILGSFPKLVQQFKKSTPSWGCELVGTGKEIGLQKNVNCCQGWTGWGLGGRLLVSCAIPHGSE